MSRILFLTQVLPYPIDAGPKLRAYYVMRYLAQRHSVVLLSFTRHTDSSEAVANLETFCERVVGVPMPRSRWRDGLAFARSLQSMQPFLIARDRVPDMVAQVQRAASDGQVDIVHADQLWMAQFVIGPNFETLKHSNVRTILDQHNAVHLIPQRMAANTHNPLVRRLLRREACLMARYEAQVCQQFDHIIWVTQEDYHAVQNQQHLLSQQSTNRKSTIPNPQSIIRNPTSEIRNSIIPICIDPSEIQPIDPLPKEPVILFIGGMHWPPNAEGVRWFVGKVFPIIRDNMPQAQLFLVGKSPPDELKDIENVIIPGYVNDPGIFWERSGVFVVPLLSGGGMRVKIIDAWAHGMPVVSTSIGAEGIEFHSGEDILIADQPHEFAQAVLKVLTDSNLGKRLGCAGRASVESRYDWRKVYSALDEIYSPPVYQS